jgi:protein-disulfide isomerase
MLRKLNSMMLLVLFLTAGSMPARSLDQATGQILGGSLKSPVRIEVFSDFQCPGCRQFYLNVIQQVLQEYSSKDKVCVIYHENPLQGHQYSREAARYAEAAARLGRQKLLAVYLALFTDQAQWGQDGKLEATISKVMSREDFQKLKNLMQDSSIDTAIEKELQLGKLKEVQSTPTMFLYYKGKEKKVVGADISYLVMKQFLDQILN